MANDQTIDIAAGLPKELTADSRDAQVWRLLCARTLAEVDPTLEGIHADDIAGQLAATRGYQELEADAAAYLWLARTQGVSTVVSGA
jgi:hypothetical protein